MDLISELPLEIKHRIIYFTPPRYAARTSVLSKLWYSAWDSRPALELTDYDFSRRHNFALFLEQSLHRFVDREISTDSLLLSISRCGPPTSSAITRFISAAALREVTIHITRPKCSPITIPSSKTLTALTLSGFGLNIGVFPLLRSISLDRMTLDSAAVEELVSNSPLLEILSISYAPAVVDLRLLPRLKRLHVTVISRHGSLAVTAPRLESFGCTGRICHNIAMEIKLQGCEGSLKELSLENLSFKDKDWVQNQVSKMGALEDLNIQDVSGLESLRIASTKLCRLNLRSCHSLSYGPTEIYAPNLVAIECSGNMFPFYTLTGSSRQLKTVSSQFEMGAAPRPDWFTTLRHLFEKVGHLEDVVVKIECVIIPGIAIVHRGLDNHLFWMLSRLDNSGLELFVTIANVFNNGICLLIDACGHHLKHVFAADHQLVEDLSKAISYLQDEDELQYSISYDQDLRGGVAEVDAHTNTALSNAYADQPPFKYTRFTLTSYPPYL